MRRTVLGTASIIPFLTLGLTTAAAQPVGASVVGGEAQVLSSGANTIVNQNSAKAIINWQDFSVRQGASVQFNQPNSAAITLNRVTGSNLSTIDGAIRANGQVWLLNPNGVLLGNNARVNVGGLLATTSDLANQDFMAGRYNFSGGGNGEIVNNGRIRAHGGGSVVLSGPRVTNRGLISARSGHVVLAGTDTFTVDFNGDRLLSYAVGASTQTGSVTNSGTVKAQGGQILMTARAASGVQDAVINNTGMAEATSAHSVNGEIILDAGESAATNAGTLNASGKDAGETGGTVKLLGRAVAVTDGAAIDVSGTAGGGTVMIGGNFQGKGSEQHAQATIIGKASINADAIARGNGGKVAVWSDGRTDFAGSITARGGAGGGKGGQVETSGNTLNIPAGAFVSTLAPQGKTGNWLLDPHTIFIVNGGATSATGQTFNNSPQVDANIDPGMIDSALRSSDLTLQAATDIIFQNNLTINGAGTAGRTLTLQAGRTIDMGSSSLSYAAGNVVIIANDPGGPPTGFRDPGNSFIQTSGGTIGAASLDLILSSGGIGIGSSASPLIVDTATPTYIKTNNIDVYITTGTSSIYHLPIGNSGHALGVDIGTGNLNLVVNGAQQTAPIQANSLNISIPSGITSGNPVTLTNTANVITGFVNIAARGRNSDGSPFVQLTNSQALTLGTVNVIRNTTGDTGAAGSVSISSQAVGQDLTLKGNITTESLVTLSAAGNIINNSIANVITAPAVSLNSSFASVGAGNPIQLAGLSNVVSLQVSADTATGSVGINTTNTGTTTLGLSGGTFGVKGRSVSLTSVGTIAQLSTGIVSANTATVTATGSAGFISLNTANNAISIANLFAPLSVTLNNTGDLTLNAARGNASPAGAPVNGSIYIQTTGNLILPVVSGSPPPVLGGTTTSSGALLRAGGSILSSGSGNAAVISVLELIADTGTIGTTSQPFVISANGFAAKTTNKDIILGASVFNSQPLIINNLATGAVGLIPATNLSGINAGTGNLQINGAALLAVQNTSAGPIVANNFKVTSASVSLTGVSVNALTGLSSAGNFSVTSPFGLFVSDSGGLSGINASGALSLTAQAGSISQASGAAGTITAPTASFTALGTSSSVALNQAPNAIGSITAAANGAVYLFNTGNLIINSIRGSTGPTSFASFFNVQTSGTMTVASTPTGAPATIYTSGPTAVVLLHAGGTISQGTGTSASGNQVYFISDSGALGTSTSPLTVSANFLSGRTTNQDMFLQPVGTAGLAIAGFSTSGFGLNANATATGLNAGTGDIQLLAAPTQAVSAASLSSPIIGNNLRVTGASFTAGSGNVTIKSFSASTSGAITINNNGGFQINNLSGGTGIQSSGAAGNVSLTATGGNITQFAGATGAISVVGGLSAIATGPTGSVLLPNSLNAVGGPVGLAGLGTMAFTNSVNTTLSRIAGNGNTQGATPAQAIDIEVLGAGHSLTISASSGIAVNGNAITLHATGDILAGTGSAVIAGINLGLISDTGSIGSFSSTGAGQIPLLGIGNLAARAAGNIYLISSATQVNNAVVVTPITIGSVSNSGPGGGIIDGISAGGIVRLGFGSFDVFAPSLIKADTLFVSGNSISLDNIAVNTLSAFSTNGVIDITSAGSFNINNTVSLSNGPGISTAGAVYLTSSGTITQSSGTAGAITAGNLSVFGTGGVNLNNSANAISGALQLGSLGDALLVNSLATSVDVALAGGTLTISSGGDLTLLAGPSIATRSNGQGLNINDSIVLGASTFTNVNGSLLSLRNGGDGIVLSTPGNFINNFGSAALALPAGARFLVYSADPATDVFGGLKAPNQGVFGAIYPAAITAAGSRYVFSVASSTNTDFLGGGGLAQGSSTAAAPALAASSTNTDFLGGGGLAQGSSTAAAPALAAFIVGLQPPPRSGNAAPNASATANGSAAGGALAAPDAARLAPFAPPPPPPPPPRNSPLADLAGPDAGNAEPPSASDQATSYVVGSLEGGPPPVTGGSGGGTLIPRYLTSQPTAPSGTLDDPSQLPAFGNLSLWQ